MSSFIKATPEVRKFMHTDKQNKQIKSVTKKKKIYGHEAAPKYHDSPDRLNSTVLEQRVFIEEKNDKKKKNNK